MTRRNRRRFVHRVFQRADFFEGTPFASRRRLATRRAVSCERTPALPEGPVEFGQEDDMTRGRGVAVAAALALVMGAGDRLVADRAAHDDGIKVRTRLSGLNEPPAVFTSGRGEFEAVIAKDGSGFNYTLSYDNLEGTVTQSHIHIGQPLVNGGIAIWLCQTATNVSPIATTPTCPGPNSGTVEGVITAADVIGPNGQGISPQELEAVFKAMLRGFAYVNVHSTRSPGGEIRGQLDLDLHRGHGPYGK
jgi:hypothetical protein